MDRFSSLVHVQHFDGQNFVEKKKRKEKNMQFLTIPNTCNIANHFKKLMSKILT